MIYLILALIIGYYLLTNYRFYGEIKKIDNAYNL